MSETIKACRMLPVSRCFECYYLGSNELSPFCNLKGIFIDTQEELENIPQWCELELQAQIKSLAEQLREFDEIKFIMENEDLTPSSLKQKIDGLEWWLSLTEVKLKDKSEQLEKAEECLRFYTEEENYEIDDRRCFGQGVWSSPKEDVIGGRGKEYFRLKGEQT